MTKSAKSRHRRTEPTPAHMLCIAALLAGSDDATAAAAGGLTRQQLNHLKNHDIRFISTMRSEANKITAAVRDDVTEITRAALKTIKTHIVNGDAASAKFWLDRCATLSDAISGSYQNLTHSQPTDAEIIALEIATRDSDKFIADEFDPLEGSLIRDQMIARRYVELVEAFNESSP